MGAEYEENERKPLLIGTAKVAEMLDVNPVFVRKLVREKKLKRVKVGPRVWKFRVTDVVAYVNSLKVAS